VFVYLPPNCELRGGAWVVVDPTINSDMMEMYADPESRGGVLEPEGIVSIKFREAAKAEAMGRLDDTYRGLKTQLKECKTAEGKQALQAQLQERYELLDNMYHQVAVNFADLHDRASRMKHKDCIREVVSWAQARCFFYWRLRRRLGEEMVRRAMLGANPRLTREQSAFMMRRWFFDSVGADKAHLWEDDEAVAQWFASSVDAQGQLAADSPLSRKLKSVHMDGAMESIKEVTERPLFFGEGEGDGHAP
jgi:acetyl-CoA carboxylase/biotin carboxylase 1